TNFGNPTSSYTLTLEETGLANPLFDSGALSRWYLQSGDSHMYAFLNNGTLDITGSTGYGMALSRSWKQTTAQKAQGQISSTYTASGTVSLATAAGALPITLPSGLQLTVTTNANAVGQFIGSVASAGLTAPGRLSSFNPGGFLGQFKQQFGLDANLL